MFAEAELLALRSEGVDHVGGGTALVFFGRAENIEPEDLETQRPQAGEVMEIEPLHPAAFGIARAPSAGDDDLIHGSSLCGAAELEFAHAGVVPAARDQIVVATALDDLAVVHDEQQVGLADG